MSADRIRLGVFAGPWESGHVAQDGAVLCFRDVEEDARRAFPAGGPQPVELVPLDLSLFASSDALSRALDGLDVIYANCGPLAAFLLAERARRGSGPRIVREIHTLGWIGYAFQEFVARELGRAGDRCVHVSDYSSRVWRTFRGDAGDVLYNPLLDGDPPPPARPDTEGGTVLGYFSRVTRDKGFHRLPEVAARLADRGWGIRALRICGQVEDRVLFDEVVSVLETAGVAVTYHGELSHAAALAVMAEVDVVLFLTTSSFEAGGRVVAEARLLSRTVVAADYCAGRDLIAEPFRIPLAGAGPVTGRTGAPFEMAQLDVAGWRAPAPGDGGSPFRGDAARTEADLAALVLDDPSAPPAPAGDPGPVRMHIDWEPHARRPVMDWCEAVHAGLAATLRGREDLLDLGGAMKRSLLAAGFDPAVTFDRRGGKV